MSWNLNNISTERLLELEINCQRTVERGIILRSPKETLIEIIQMQLQILQELTLREAKKIIAN